MLKIMSTLLLASERRRISRYFEKEVGYKPDLNDPRTFSEKLQQFKLRWRTPAMVELTNKVTAKAAVAAILGDDWIIPTIWHGRSLPDAAERQRWQIPYVIKANQGSGGNYFVREPRDLDWPGIEKITDMWMAKPHGVEMGEWAYGQIAPELLVEPVLGGATSPVDYKLLVFRGRVEYVRVHLDRFGDHRIHHYDRNWKKQPVSIMGYSNAGAPVNPPASLERMIEAAERLAAVYRFPFVRIDFYEVDGAAKFGEVTLYSDSGCRPMAPREYEDRAGALWGDVGLS